MPRPKLTQPRPPGHYAREFLTRLKASGGRRITVSISADASDALTRAMRCTNSTASATVSRALIALDKEER